MADENARELAEREEKAFTAKANLDALWQELALNFYPERADFTSERCLGEEFAVDVFDSEPMRCRRDLGNARASMLRPRGQEWFRAETQDEQINEQPHIARFFEALNKQARNLLYAPDSGYVRCEKEADQDVVTFGGSIKTAESEIDRQGRRILMVRSWHPRDCAWYDDMTGVRQDVMFRRFKSSARHIRKKFPDAQLHDTIKHALEKEPDREFRLCHVMMPADEYDYYDKKAKRSAAKVKAPWVSVYYDSEHKMLLRERPSQRFRYVVDRWQTISGSQYGYSPAAMTSLPDARGMQTMAMVLLEAGEKELDPPLLVQEGAVKSDIDAGAAGITWTDAKYDERNGRAVDRLYPPGRNLPIGIDLINRTTLALRDNWFLTKLSLPQQAKTAFETAQLVEEFIRANIPLFEPWEAGTAMMLDEVFGVLIDMGAFGPLDAWPQELSGADITFAFANPLQDAIKRNRVNQAQQVLGIVAAAMAIDPAAGKAINAVKMIQDAVRGTGAPADWVHDEQDTDAAIDDAAQAQDILGALGMAEQAAGVVNTGAQAAATLQELNQPAVDGSAVYGPV